MKSMNPSATFSQHKNAKTKSMHKPHKNLHIIVECVEILDHQKWIEIVQIKIMITHSQNIINLVHI